MELQDFFFLTAGIGILVFIGAVMFVTYQVYLVIKVVRVSLARVNELSQEALIAKNYMKLNGLNIISKLVKNGLNIVNK